MPGLKSVNGLACRAAGPMQSPMVDLGLPGSVLWVAAADPPCLVTTPQGHFTG